MKTIEKGKFVKVHYTGKLDNDEVFDSSNGCHPLEIQIGEKQLIKGFEDALMGMGINETKTFTLKPEEAYGQRDDNLKRVFQKSEIPPQVTPEVGQAFGLNDPNGGQIRATVIEVDSEKVVMDLNHPLAGKTLTFEIEVLEINDEASQAPPSCSSGCACPSGS